jgi:hypothetical protein
MIFPDDDTPTPAVHVPAALRVYAGLPPVPWLRPSPPRAEVVRTSVRPHRPNSPVMAFEHLLGKVQDKEIAAMAGVSSGMVRKVRRLLGVPACPAARRA